MKILNIINIIYKYLNYSYSIKGIFIFGFCVLFLGIPKRTLATAYYVSNSGNNNNNGALTSPFKSITFAMSKIKGGDTIYVRGGTYVEQVVVYQKSGTKNKPTIVTSYPGEKPVIDGQTSLPKENYSSMVMIWDDYVVFSGFEVKNSGITGAFIGSRGIVSKGNYVIIQNCIVHDCWSSGINILLDHNIVQDCIVYNTSLDNSLNPGAQNNGSGISIRGYMPEYSSDSCIIRRNVIHDIWGEAVSTVESHYSIIEDNVIYDGWSVNLYVNNATNSLVQRNLIYQTKDMNGGTQVGIGQWDEDGSPILNKNNIFINNIVSGCRRNFYSTEMIGTLVSNNTFINSTYFACVQISDNKHENGAFINNIIFQEGEPLPIYALSNPEMLFHHNLWSKTPLVDVIAAGDIIGDPMFEKTGSMEAGKLDPKYFKLLGNSPAINKGIKNDFVTHDIFHNERDALPDIGASEYRIAVTGITVTGNGNAQTITTYKGTLQLSATILPVNATNKSITWSIKNDTGQAAISPTGLVTAVSDGTVTVTATSNDGSGVSGSL
ncbi:MAG: Ig-like domain-containing protein, partial [Bacteroidales bacterium]|nr:Ig-like domain-containing protein [Bacteroidales bacterium]